MPGITVTSECARVPSSYKRTSQKTIIK